MRKIVVIAITVLTSAVGLNSLLIPIKAFSAGMNGITQIIATLLYTNLGIHINIGVFILFLNIPVFIPGFIELGKQPTILSFINVIGISVVTMFVPIVIVITNPLVSTIMGGVLVGVGAGLSLKMDFNTGGMDIISLILPKTIGKTVGNFIFLLNDIIVLLVGFIFNWEGALHTIISIYYLSQVVDMIHTNHQRVTVMIVTMRPEAVALEVSQQVACGMTLLPSIGGYSGVEGRAIMMVITRYELHDLGQAVYSIDENAFVNILPTRPVLGCFANEDEQQIFHSTGAFPELQSYKMKRYPPKKKLK